MTAPFIVSWEVYERLLIMLAKSSNAAKLELAARRAERMPL